MRSLLATVAYRPVAAVRKLSPNVRKAALPAGREGLLPRSPVTSLHRAGSKYQAKFDNKPLIGSFAQVQKSLSPAHQHLLQG